MHVESFASFVAALTLAVSSVVQSAVGLLPAAGIPEKDIAPIVEVDQRPSDSHENVEAWHRVGDPHIYILTTSDVYKAARVGDQQAIKKLASIIAHENVHVQGGQEEQAYKTQIATLRRLNASPQMIQGVQAAMKSVLASNDSSKQ